MLSSEQENLKKSLKVGPGTDEFCAMAWNAMSTMKMAGPNFHCKYMTLKIMLKRWKGVEYFHNFVKVSNIIERSPP
jgi:hypothetical protein